jgi:hypothetical protein
MFGSTFWENNMSGSTFLEKRYWQQILGKNMISNTFGVKHDWQYILGK